MQANPRDKAVLVAPKFENLEDVCLSESGLSLVERVRAIEVKDAVVNMKASGLLLPKRHVLQLGLRLMFSRPHGTGEMVWVPMYSAVRLTIQGRDCSMDVGEVSDDMPIVIGRIPLHALDWVVDPNNQRLIGNPEHGGERMMEIF